MQTVWRSCEVVSAQALLDGGFAVKVVGGEESQRANVETVWDNMTGQLKGLARQTRRIGKMNKQKDIDSFNSYYEKSYSELSPSDIYVIISKEDEPIDAEDFLNAAWWFERLEEKLNSQTCTVKLVDALVGYGNASPLGSFSVEISAKSANTVDAELESLLLHEFVNDVAYDGGHSNWAMDGKPYLMAHFYKYFN